MTTFSAQVQDWVREQDGAMEAVFKGSVEDVAIRWAKSVKRITGMLAGSTTVGVNAEPADVEMIRSPESVALEIDGLSIGDVAKIRQTAAYAWRYEYGFSGEDSLGRSYNQAGSGKMRAVVQQWPQIVAENEAKVGAALGR